MADEQTYYCWFCSKSNRQVEKMILAWHGDAVPVICNECVDLCATVIAYSGGCREMVPGDIMEARSDG